MHEIFCSIEWYDDGEWDVTPKCWAVCVVGGHVSKYDRGGGERSECVQTITTKHWCVTVWPLMMKILIFHCPHSIPTHDTKFPFHSTAITGRQYNRSPSADIHFPNPSDLINFTKSDNTSSIRIPQIPIREKFEELKEGGKSCRGISKDKDCKL